MGKPTGFMDYQRAEIPELPVTLRIKNWDEFVHIGDLEGLQTQGARCMDCGIPFCHSGILINGLASGCPLKNLIPEWNDLIYRNQWAEAARRLFKTNNFPEFTGRVCPAPCESACTLGIIDPPVTIKNIERAISDYAYTADLLNDQPPESSSGKSVAVIGSGPAGLACAEELNKMGHEVVVYERDDRPGGLLMYGIPNMKLSKELVQKRLQLMAATGIEFITNTEVGVHVEAETLVARHDAVVLCAGATQARDLQISGRHSQGIYLAMDYLTSNTKCLLDGSPSHPIDARDRNVVVIGGGDTGTDCVGSAIRQGCKTVTQLEILPKPPLERGLDNPWPQWPHTYKLDYGQAEAKELYGSDPRQYQTLTKEFLMNETGQLTGLRTVDLLWKSKDGRLGFEEVQGSDRTLRAELVLLALGFTGPEKTLPEQLGLEQDERSNVKAEYGHFRTNREKIFVAGDMRRGQSLVVWAIDEGRGAAKACDEYLSQAGV